MVAAFQEAKPKLLKLYAKYASSPPASQDRSKDAASTTTWPQLLSAAALKAMLYDGGMFCAGDAKSHDQVFAAAVDQCFSGMRDVRLSEDQRLVFAEFLEVVARVALAVLGDEHDLPPRDAIKIALDALRSLPLKPVAVAASTASRRK